MSAIVDSEAVICAVGSNGCDSKAFDEVNRKVSLSLICSPQIATEVCVDTAVKLCYIFTLKMTSEITDWAQSARHSQMEKKCNACLPAGRNEAGGRGSQGRSLCCRPPSSQMAKPRGRASTLCSCC